MGKQSKGNEEPENNSDFNKQIIIALIGFAGVILAAFIGLIGTNIRNGASETATASVLLTQTSPVAFEISEPIRVTSQAGNETEPQFSDDGGSIVFIADGDGNQEIYTIQDDGLFKHRITNTPQGEDLPSFSPDGQSILFGANYTGNDELYLLRLSESPTSTNITNTPNINEGRGRFVLGGNRIIFDSDQTGNWDIYIGEIVDGFLTNVRNLTNRPEYQDRYPVVSSLLANVFFRASPIFDETGTKSSLYSIQFNGANLQALTSENDDRHPSINSDESWLTFQSDRDGNTEIYAINLKSGEFRRLTDHPADDSFPSFSKDGRWIVFSSNRDGSGYDLYKIPFQP